MKKLLDPRWRFVLPLGLLALTAAVSLNMIACTPGSGVSVQESDVVLTLYDNTVDFGAIDYFAMPDTIIHLGKDGPEDSLLNRESDEKILDLLAANFEARGYQRVQPEDTLTTPPDVMVFVSATAIDFYNAWSYYPWYPGWGGGWWGCCYGGWYPPPSVGVSYAYTTGTLMVDMPDAKQDLAEDEAAPVYWSGNINGILNDTSANKAQRLADSINQMFEQSPYLRSRPE